ncbi:MAG: DNA ligase [Pseudomonadota bacterium]|nr:DNA ligase [Pseudomonadota bacterium]
MTHMTSDQAFSAIEKIASTSSKNDKQAMVKQFLAFETFKRVLVAALDPLVTYGMQQVPDRIADAAPGANTFENAPIWETLDKLAARTLTGNDARNEVQRLMTFLTPQSAELFKRIIRKDLRAGFSESTVNKAWKGLIPEFPYMRCALLKDAKLEGWTWADGVFSQEKADGMFMNIDHEVGGLVRITSRQGSPFPIEAFAEFEDHVRAMFPAGTQSHGEMLVYVDGKVAPREISNGILNRVAAGGAFEANEEPRFFAWDQIPLAAVVPKGKYELTYRERFKAMLIGMAAGGSALQGYVPMIQVIPTRVVKSLEEAMTHYRELLAKGKEGTIIKNGAATWKDGTSKEQIKLKLEVDVDLKIVAIAPGRVGTKNEGRAGAFTCETAEGQLRVDVTVKNEALRDQVDANGSDFIGRIIAVRANCVMKPGDSSPLHSLFLPRMVEAGYRTDKTEPDTLAQVIEQFDAAVGIVAEAA